MPTNPEPWLRQPGESKVAFEAFTVYREQTGRRSMRMVAQRLGKSITLMTRWAARWHWTQRVRAWDDHLAAIDVEEQRHEIRATRKRAAQQLRAKAQTLMLPDMWLSKRIQEAGGDLDKVFPGVTPLDMLIQSARSASALPNILRAEALALGDVTDRPHLVAGDDALTRQIQDNDDLTSLAAKLIEQASDLDRARPRQITAGSLGPSSEPRQVDEPSALDLPQSVIESGSST